MIGQKLGSRYEVLSELGHGGMGVVYRALDPLLNREVAVKVISPSLLSPETEQRFQTEAQLVAQMDHASIVTIYDFGRHEESLFFVMPVVEGESLRSLLKRGALTLGLVVDIGIEIAEALDYSHSRGVIHRDIKPENIMVSLEDASGVRVRIMDFGLARGNNLSSLTKTGMLMGTMWYLSPEQVLGGKVDARSDIYAFGSVLYECIANEVPFTGEVHSLLYRVVHEIPRSLRSLGIPVDEELDEIVLSCLAKEPEKRPQSGGELARWLRRYRAGMQESQRGLTVMATRSMVAPRAALSPFVGRDQEFKELQRRLNSAIRGECQFVLISGEAGVGKTRLLDELETLAAAREIRLLHGRFVEQHGAFPYHGFCEAIQEFFLQREAGDASSAPPDLSDLADDLTTLFPMLTEISAIRAAISGSSIIGELGEPRTAENRVRVFELLARTLTRLAAGRPLVLAFEELHGAEVSIEALQYIVRRLGPTPTLIIGTFRSTEVDRSHPINSLIESFRGDRRFELLELGPFSESEHRSFLSTLTGGTAIAEDLARKVYERTEGNPFFTKELVRSLLDAGSISQDDTGTWLLSGAGDISPDLLPATIQQAVEARVGRLPEDLRRILSVASVMGKSFEFEDLEVLAESEANLDDAVDRFIQQGILEEDRRSRGDRLAFSSAVVREVLYGELGRRKRRSLHQRFAQQLEKRHAGRLERVYPQLLYHFYEADEAEKTVEYGLHHARQSMESFSPEEVIRACRTALEFLDDDWEGDPAVAGETRMMLASGYRMAGDIASALRESAAAVKVFEEAGATDRAAVAVLSAAKAAWQVRRTEETRQWVEHGVVVARKAGETEILKQLLSLAATLANLRGEYARAGEFLKEVEQLDQGAQGPVREEIPRGGRLVVAIANPIHARFPTEMQLTEEFEIFSNVFESLLATDEEGNLHPLLCEQWEVRDEGRTFHFRLRADVLFHDGSRLTAGDVRDSFQTALLRPAANVPPALAAIVGAGECLRGEADRLEGIQVPSELELEVRLVEPLPIYPALLSDPRTAIVRKSEPLAEPAYPIGSGPFRLVEQTADRVVLERNAQYWRGSPPHLDAIEFRLKMSSATIAAGLRRGEIDLARDLLPQDLDSILRERRFHDGLVESPQKLTYFVLFNSRSGPVASDQRVRQALAGSVRVQDLVWQNLGRFSIPASGLIPPGILGHDPGRRLRGLAPKEACQLLEEAVGKAPLTLRAAVHPLIRDRYGSMLDALLSSWKDLGIDVSIVSTDMNSYLQAWRNNEGLDLLILRWIPDVDDPDDCTHSLFHSGNGQLSSYFSSPETDEILDAARKESRPELRESLYRRFENALVESSSLLPLFHDIGYRIAGGSVRGIHLSSIQPYVNYSRLGKAGAARPLETPQKAGGIVRVPISGTVQIMDPTVGVLVEEAEVHQCVFETLTRDVGGARIEPWLAASFRGEDGGKRYRFKLRGDVMFHDGRRLSARDVRFSLERLLQNEASRGRWLFSSIQGARAILEGRARDLSGFRIHSASEFSIDLEKPISFFPVLLGDPHAGIVPEGTSSIGESIQTGAVGTGPFRVVRFEPGRRLELERNPSYWRKGFPKSERLEFTFGVSAESILAEFRAGRFSLAADLYPADVEALLRDKTFAAGYRETPQLSVYFLIFNIHHSPLDQKSFRQRLVRALDVPRLVKQTLGRLALPAQGLIPPGLVGHDSLRAATEPPSARYFESDETMGEVELTAAVHPIFASEYSHFARELTEALLKVGVSVRSVAGSTVEFVNAVQYGNCDMGLGRWVADYPDADTFAYQLISADGWLGRMCGIPETDQLIEAGRAEANPDARHQIYRQFEQVLAREALLVPLFYEQAYRFARPELEGLSVSYSAPVVAYENLSIRESS